MPRQQFGRYLIIFSFDTLKSPCKWFSIRLRSAFLPSFSALPLPSWFASRNTTGIEVSLILIHARNAKSGMVLLKDITDSSGNLLLEKGIELTEAYLRRLERLGISVLHVQEPVRRTIPVRPVLSEKLRTELSACFRSLFSMKIRSLAPTPVQSMYFRQMTASTEKVIDEISANMDDILNIKLREPSIDETAHAVNVCILSVVVGLHLDYDRLRIKDLALGALLHDVGRLMLSADGEDPHKDQPVLHPLWGRDLLLQNHFSEEVCRIAAEHHEHYDGSGFPGGKTCLQTSELARLVAITNHYDNLITQGSINDAPRTESVERLMALGNSHFDLKLLSAFLHTIAIFPVGSLVRLSNGHIGYVRRNNQRIPLRPALSIIAEAGDYEFDLSQHPSVTIVGLLEE